MSKFITVKELREWKDGGWRDMHWDYTMGWPQRLFDTFVEMERLLIMAADSRRLFADDIQRLLKQIEPEDGKS